MQHCFMQDHCSYFFLGPPMAEGSKALYPAGTLNSEASCAPSLMLVKSVRVPSSPCTLTGKWSFWSIHIVALPRVLSVTSHLSQVRPFTVSVPSFLQVLSGSLVQGSVPPRMWSILRSPGDMLLWRSPWNSTYICCWGMSI